jgi:LysM repeat protein
VTILDLKNQPSPKKKKALYDVEAFRLQVKGEVENLLRFISRVHETIDFKSFVISNVSIVPHEDAHLLTMDIALYTSLYASEGVSTSPVIEGALGAKEPVQVNYPTAQPTVEETQSPSLIERESYKSPRPQSWPTHWPWPPPGEGEAPGTVPQSELPPHEELHVVQEGETLLSIALRHGSSVEAIVTANHLENGRFHVGQHLRVPVYDGATHSPEATRTPSPAPASPTLEPPGVETYTVKQGDTLSGIARRFGTSVKELMRLNDLGQTQIYVGQILQIPIEKR